MLTLNDYVVSIDPGKDGGVAFFLGGTVRRVFPLSTKSWSQLAMWVHEVATSYNKKYIFIEDVHAIYKARANSTFSFGANVGEIKGFFRAFGLTDFYYIVPTDWQRAVTNKPLRPFTRGMEKSAAEKIKEQHKANLKLESIRAAQLFCPDIDLGNNDGLADAVNIGRYGIRLILNGELHMAVKAKKKVVKKKVAPKAKKVASKKKVAAKTY
jgi:hypothetical protein